VVTIGSHPRSGLHLDDTSVAPTHCDVGYRRGLWLVRDLGSEQGTSVNGVRIKEEALADGDLITVGDVLVSFELQPRPPAGRVSARVDAGHEATTRPRQRAQPASREAPVPRPPATPATLRQPRLHAPRPRSSVPVIAGVVAGITGLVLVVALAVVASRPEAQDVSTATPTPASRPTSGSTATSTSTPERSRAEAPARRAEVASATVERSGGATRKPGATRRSPAPTDTGKSVTDKGRDNDEGEDEDDELATIAMERWEFFARASVEPRVERGDYLAALMAMTSFESRDETVRERMEARRHQLETSSREECDAAIAESDRLVAKGEVRAAIQHLQQARSGLLVKSQMRIRDQVDTLRQTRGDFSKARRGFKALREVVNDDLDTLSIGTAESRIDRFRQASPKADPKLAAALDGLSRECRLVGGAWRALREALILRQKGRRGLEIPRASLLPDAKSTGTNAGERTAPFRGRVADVEETTVVLKPTGRPRRFRVLALPATLLVRLVKEHAKDDATAIATFREGLVLLILRVEGPSRAREVFRIVGEELGVVTRTRLEQRVREDTASWIERRLAVLERRAAVIAKKPSDLTAWAVLADESTTLLREAVQRDIAPATRRRSRDLFIRAESHRLPLTALFDAASVEQVSDNAVRLSWDFSKSSHARDFHPVGKAQKARVEKGRLVLQGEYRIGTGDPFADRLRVEIEAQVAQPTEANVNVALWTRARDELTWRNGKTVTWLQKLRQKPGEPADWAVFGAGYRTIVCQSLERDSEEVVLAGTRESIALPAYVVLAGDRYKMLHSDLGECLLARPLEAESAPTLWSSVIDWTPAAISWLANDKTILEGNEMVNARLLDKRERVGSVSLLTNDRVVEYDRVEIVARLASPWVAERRRTLATERLGRLFGDEFDADGASLQSRKDSASPAPRGSSS